MLNEPIGKRRLTVINMRNDGEISYMTEFSHSLHASKKGGPAM